MKKITGLTRSNSLSRALENQIAKVFLYFLFAAKKLEKNISRPSGNYNALICKWCCMGDAILSLYAIREFKIRNPNVTLDILVSSRIAEVYQNSDLINHVYVLPITGHGLLLELFSLKLWIRLFSFVSKLRKKKYAEFIDLELYRSTGPVLKWLLKIPYSRGFIVEGALNKNHNFETSRPRNMMEWQCFYKIFELEVPTQNPLPLFPLPQKIQDEKNRTIASSSQIQTHKIGIVFGSSFNWPQKKWPAEYFAETISILSEKNFEFVLYGTASEKNESRLILSSAKGNINDTTGCFNYSELKNSISECDLVFGNDTGTLHLASACGVKTFTLFGPTDPEKWNGLTSTPLYLKDLACRPCYYLGSMPACDHFSCLRKLTPLKVATEIEAFFRQKTLNYF